MILRIVVSGVYVDNLLILTRLQDPVFMEMTLSGSSAIESPSFVAVTPKILTVGIAETVNIRKQS